MRHKSKKVLNIGIIWANPFSKNLGVSALAYSILNLLDDIELNENIDMHYYFFFGAKYFQSDIQIMDKKFKIKIFPACNFMNVLDLIKFLFKTKLLGIIDIIKLDFILDVSEGDSFSDIYGAKRFMNIINSKRFFHLIKKKQILLPQTIGPFKDNTLKLLAFKTLKKMDVVYVRDQRSYDFVNQSIRLKNLVKTIDLAFSLPYKKQKFSEDFIHVGLNISGLIWNGGYNKNNQFGLKADYKKLIKDIIEYFLSVNSIKIHLIGHVLSKEKDSVENDYKVNIELIKLYSELIIAPKFSDPIEAKSYISGMDFFIGTRMHSCIAAFSSGVPVFPLAYSRKFNGLFNDTLNYDYLGDCVKYNNDKILDKLIFVFNSREDIAIKLNQWNSLNNIDYYNFKYKFSNFIL